MQALVDAIRPVAPRNLILLGGIRYSNSLSQWMNYAPVDANLAPAWHLYSLNSCVGPDCWNAAPAAIAADLPIVTTELGQDDCGGGFSEPVMGWLDGRGLSYLAWSWNAAPARIPGRGAGGRPWPLIMSRAPQPAPTPGPSATTWRRSSSARPTEPVPAGRPRRKPAR